jgi:N-acetylneuraminic acid mutarotase
VVGGYDENGIVKGLLASCEVFDPYLQRWTPSLAPLLRARWGHGCASLGGRIHVVGGCSLRPGAPPREAFMETLRSCEVYDPVLNRWEPFADLHRARAGARVVTLGGRYLVAVGGCDDVFGRAEMLPTVELYDPAVGHWVLLETQLSTPRTTAAVAALDDRRVLVVGGAPSLSSSEVYGVQFPCDPAEDNKQDEDVVLSTPEVSDMAEGRMGCQAAALWLPSASSTSTASGGYPLCDTRTVVVVGGENGDEEDWDYGQTFVRQFNSVLVYDAEMDSWRESTPIPPMPTPRTTTALCVGFGRIDGHL